MTDATTEQIQFRINQLRLQNLYQWMQFLAIAIMIIFTTSLLPSLLLRYVYKDDQMLTPPPIFEIIPVFSFVLGVVVFAYAGIGNIMRELKAVNLEKMLNGNVKTLSSVPTMTAKPASTDLQSAMKNLAAKDAKRSTKTVAAQRATARTTKTRRPAGRRKTK